MNSPVDISALHAGDEVRILSKLGLEKHDDCVFKAKSTTPAG